MNNYIAKTSKTSVLLFAFSFITFSACEKPVIKPRKLYRVWKIAGISMAHDTTTTTTIAYNKAACNDLPNDAGISTVSNSNYTLLKYDEFLESTNTTTDSTTISDSKGMTFSASITIEKLGTYHIRGKYRYQHVTKTNDTIAFRGSFATHHYRWHFENSDKRNRSIVFENFIDNISISNLLDSTGSGSPIGTFRDRKFDIDETSKSQIIFRSASVWSNTNTIKSPPYDTFDGQQNTLEACQKTTTVAQSGSMSMTFILYGHKRRKSYSLALPL